MYGPPRVLRLRALPGERLLEVATETARGVEQGVRPAWAGAGKAVRSLGSWALHQPRCQCHAHLQNW